MFTEKLVVSQFDFGQEYAKIGRHHATKNRLFIISFLISMAMLCLLLPQGLLAS